MNNRKLPNSTPKKDVVKPVDMKLYNEVKEQIMKDQPKHSLFRSARIQKEYKSKNGTYTNDKPENTGIKGWMKSEWISLNDFS